MKTHILTLPPSSARLGEFVAQDSKRSALDEWRILPEAASVDALRRAAEHLRTRDTPVAFPTETVYGLGADATRSAAVRGIYAAKGRPSDNPLIVHVADLRMLRDLLGGVEENGEVNSGQDGGEAADIPERYRVLVERFWPGPLTILLRVPRRSRLAPEVTAGLATFGARMPASPLALSLIKMAGVPLAAPSANASTRPSPTTAQHVRDDLDGRIELVLDGGACAVGVESTVVDGLCDPPVVLRPGGVGIDDLRRCPGWEGVRAAYRDHSEEGSKETAAAAAAPRAPGMKYKHYSPRARVVLYEASCAAAGAEPVADDGARTVGVIRTHRWSRGAGMACGELAPLASGSKGQNGTAHEDVGYEVLSGDLRDARTGEPAGRLFDIDLGGDTRGIAHGLFSALRELDRLGVDVIFVDGIRGDLDIAAAVMNRLRKAASEIRS